MTVKETAINGVLVIEPKVFGDGRGWFMESYSQVKLEKLGVDAVFVQDNQSYTAQKGTLRGLHCQLVPYAQAKLIRVLRGAVLDVAVDIREGSPTYKQQVAIELSGENKKQLFIPKGCLHGFLSLTDDVELFYKCDAYYAPQYDRSIRWDDPDLGVRWNIDAPVMSEKDADAPLLKNSDVRFGFAL